MQKAMPIAKIHPSFLNATTGSASPRQQHLEIYEAVFHLNPVQPRLAIWT